MIVQYTAAALASENKVLAHPASVDSVPTSANQEDHVSMGPIAARHARTVLEHVERIVAIELRVASEAIDHRRRLLAAEAGTGRRFAAGARRRGRRRSRPDPGGRAALDGDREPGPDLAAVTRLVHDGELVDLVAGSADPGATA